MAATEFLHKELQNLFKDFKEATDCSLIEKSSVDFIEPYLALIDEQNVVE